MPSRSDRALVWTVLALASAVCLAMQLWLVDWYVEDAAITYTYAKHLATGEGLVAYPGGERVEGFSNPTWMVLLAALYPLGINPFAGAKWAAGIASVLTVWITWAIGQRLVDDADPLPPLVAATLLAVNPQFAIWNAAGLENPLFSLLLALGIWRLLVEHERGGHGVPWSAVWFALLALTRPEALMYGLVGLVWTAVLYRHRLGVVATWLGVLAVPVAAYEVFRLAYFAWPLPNTYYAKLGDESVTLMAWQRHGWRYVREWAEAGWIGAQLPLIVLAVVGVQRWRWRLTMGIVAVGALFLLLPAPAALHAPAWWADPPLPGWWDEARIIVLATITAIAGVAGIGRPGWRVRGLCLWLVAACVFFTVYTDGDWMRGWRWMSLISVPLSLLLAAGWVDLGRLLGRHRLLSWAPAATALAAIAVATVPAQDQLVRFRTKPVTSVHNVLERVRYNNALQRLLLLDRATNLEVDMGATMYWSGDDLIDIAGLNDVPFAHHHYDQRFVTEYVFRERRPHFMHTHRSWARKLGVRRIAAWREGWVETPGYSRKGYGKGHDGCMVRKDLFVTDAWEGPDDRWATLETGVEIVGFRMPTAKAARSGRLVVELAMRATPRERRERFTVLLFLHGPGGIRSWSAPVGYTWYPPEDWGDGEIVYTHLTPEMDGLAPGTYDLGIVVMDRDGVLLPREAADAATAPSLDGSDPAFALGEVVWASAVEILADDDAAAEVRRHLTRMETQADEGHCGAAERAWRRARAFHPMDEPWLREHIPAMERALGRCHVVRATQADTDEERIRRLIRARDWDHRNPDQRRLAAPLARQRHADGLAARAMGDWVAAYRAFSDAVALDARRSWSRRYAEEARAHRLGLDR